MRFMMLVKANKDYEAGAPHNPELSQAIMTHAEKMAKAGVLLDTGGLLPSSKGARINVSGGKMTVIDGPFAEAKELIGGYAIIRADSMAQAVELGKEFMSLHIEALGDGYSGELEIRPFEDA